MRLPRVSAAAILLLCLLTACEDEPASRTPYSIHITQPANNAAVGDTVVRILTAVQSSCSCRTHVEFYIDGTLRSTDVLPEYSYDWRPAGMHGAHTIAARVVVRDEGEMWDSVRVVVDTTHSLAGRPAAR
jgi:hypothetical protein